MATKNVFHYFTKNDVDNSVDIKNIVDNMIKIIDKYIIPKMNEANIKYNHSRSVLTFRNMVVTLTKEFTGRGTPQELKFKIEDINNNIAIGFKTTGKGRDGQERDSWYINMAMKWHEVHMAAKKIACSKPDYTKINSWIYDQLDKMD